MSWAIKNLFKVITSRLERKLALLLSLVGLLSLVVLGSLAIRTIHLTRQRNVAELEWQLVNQSVSRLRKFIDDKLETFRIVVADPNVAIIGPEQQKFLARAQLETDSTMIEVDFLSPDALSPGRWNVLRQVRAEPNPVYLNVEQDKDLAIVSALKKKNYLSSVYLVAGQPYLTLGTPVVNQQGQVIGALRGEVNLDSLLPLVAQSNLGNRGSLYVVDQEARLMAWSTNFDNSSDRRGVRYNFKAPAFVQEIAAGKWGAVTSEAASYFEPRFNESVFSVGRTIPRLNWTVVAAWPQTEALEVVSSLIAQLTWATGGLLILLILLSLFVARQFTKPLRALKTATEAVGQGKFDVELNSQSLDEVGELSRSFQSMTRGLKELERLKDEFVFIAAHELRTPVTAIRGYAEMLGDVSKDLPQSGKEFVTRLQQAGSRLATLVNDLLEVARSQAGRLKFATSPQNLVALVQTTLNELLPLAQEKKHTLVYTPPASLPPVMADKDKLQEVLVNLIGNAIKYTPTGGRVEVTLTPQDKEMVIGIKDNGLGISKEDQSKLFQRFFRVESEETKDIQGTGLGLFIVRQLVEKMDGRIWVASEKGKGSTFFFSLLLAQPNKAAPNTASPNN
ncbi:MAG: sensor histidine kinase [Candidatus Kerfeldbacteria bacterium]|nr:sensor histidine kinase [Candidatus Kerfeldbacteria bacterium]